MSMLVNLMGTEQIRYGIISEISGDNICTFESNSLHKLREYLYIAYTTYILLYDLGGLSG